MYFIQSLTHAMTKQNIMSISKIIDLGFSMKFSKDQCKIFNKDMKQIAGAKRVGNLYSLSEVIEKDEASLNMEDTKLKNLE